MATSAAGGGPGPGPGGSFRSVQAPVKAPKIIGAVTAAAAAVYVIWELRVRASRRLGHIPPSLTKDWQDATEERLQHTPFVSNPSKFARLNPHRHDVPHSQAIVFE